MDRENYLQIYLLILFYYFDLKLKRIFHLFLFVFYFGILMFLKVNEK